MSLFQKILVATDFDETARRALDLSLELATKMNSSVTLLHVHVPPVAQYMDGVPWPMEDFANAARAALDRELTRGRERYPSLQAALATGGAWSEIVEYARTGDHDLVVIGTHGRRGVSRFLLGSVAEKVIRTAGRPVLTVPSVEP